MDDYTKTEQYLSGILNGTPVPEPYTREEKLLAEIAEKVNAIKGLPDGENDGDTLVWDGTKWEVTPAAQSAETTSDAQQGGE